MSDRVKPDATLGIPLWGEEGMDPERYEVTDAFTRSTVLRAIDREIARTRSLASRVGLKQAVSALEFSALCFEEFRTRFEGGTDE